MELAIKIFLKILQEINRSIHYLFDYELYFKITTINKLIFCLITKIKIILLVTTNNSF